MSAYVYRLYSADRVLLYIGSTGNLRTRMALHRGPNRLPGADVIHAHWLFDDVEEHATLTEARAAEREAIRTEAPLLNREHNPTRWQRIDQHAFGPVGDTADRIAGLPMYSRFELMVKGLEASRPIQIEAVA